MIAGAAENLARFKSGDAVRVDDRAMHGHCRTPWYLRGQTGEIAEVLGQFRDPERLAYHKPGLPAQMLYKVRFAQCALWPGYTGAPGDTLDADLFEHWLLAAKSPKRSTAKSRTKSVKPAPARSRDVPQRSRPPARPGSRT